jgi:hypothetical protein
MDNSHPAILGGSLEIPSIAMIDRSLDSTQLFESRHLPSQTSVQFDNERGEAYVRHHSAIRGPGTLTSAVTRSATDERLRREFLDCCP